MFNKAMDTEHNYLIFCAIEIVANFKAPNVGIVEHPGRQRTLESGADGRRRLRLLQPIHIAALNKRLQFFCAGILNPFKIARCPALPPLNALAAQNALFLDCSDHGSRVPQLARQRQCFVAFRNQTLNHHPCAFRTCVFDFI